MKDGFKRFLKKRGIYEYVRYSKLFIIYEYVLKRQNIRQFKKELSFYNTFLKEPNLIFDIGAYDGHKTAAFIKLAKTVVCCEPDSQNFQLLKIRFRNLKKRVKLNNVAIAATNGFKEYFIHHPASAFNTLNYKFKNVVEADMLQKWDEKIKYEDKTIIPTYSLDYLISMYGLPSFIKIDVEGYELEVLKGLNYKVPFLSLECLLPDFEVELYQEIDLIMKLDFDAKFNIAINEELLFPKFVEVEFLKKYLTNFKENHFELIIKMSV